MSSSKAKDSALTGGSANGPQKVKKSKPKKSIADIRAEREAIAEKIRVGEENLKKAQDGESMNIDQINAELEIHKSTLQALNEEEDTLMPDEVNNGDSVTSISDVIVTHSQSNNESDIKQKNQDAEIAITSIETHRDEDFADLVRPDDILNQDTTTDEQPIEWRIGGRGRDMILIQWESSNARIYKEISMNYCPPSYDKHNFSCLTNDRVENQKHDDVYEYGRDNKSILQNIAFAYFSTEEHSEKFLHSDTKEKRYISDSYLIKWTEDSEMLFRTWKTRITVRRVWSGNFKRVDLAILKDFLKAQIRYNEWKQDQRGSKDQSPTPDPKLQAPLITFSPSPQSIPTPSAASTSLTVSTPSPAPSQSVPAAQPASTKPETMQQPTSEATQQPTSEATSQSATETASQPVKKQVTDQEKKIQARRAFMAVMFDNMKVQEASTENQVEKVATKWAQKRIEILTSWVC